MQSVWVILINYLHAIWGRVFDDFIIFVLRFIERFNFAAHYLAHNPCLSSFPRFLRRFSRIECLIRNLLRLLQFNSLNCLNNIHRCKRQNIIINWKLYIGTVLHWLLHRSYPWNILLFHFYCFMPRFMQTLWLFRYYHSSLQFI